MCIGRFKDVRCNALSHRNALSHQPRKITAHTNKSGQINCCRSKYVRAWSRSLSDEHESQTYWLNFFKQFPEKSKSVILWSHFPFWILYDPTLYNFHIFDLIPTSISVSKLLKRFSEKSRSLEVSLGHVFRLELCKTKLCKIFNFMISIRHFNVYQTHLCCRQMTNSNPLFSIFILQIFATGDALDIIEMAHDQCSE